MAVKKIISITAMTLLAACASVGNGGTNSKASSKLDDRLAPRDLGKGECGIFVWTADNARRFIFFSQTEKSTASWWSADGEIDVTRMSSGGIYAFDQASEQSFKLPDGGNLKLSLSNPEEVDNGTRYKSGAITQTSADGWEKVIPVLGMAACNLTVVGSEYSVRPIRS